MIIELDFAGNLNDLVDFRQKYPKLTISVTQEVGPGGGNILLEVSGFVSDLVALLLGPDYNYTAEEVKELFDL